MFGTSLLVTSALVALLVIAAVTAGVLLVTRRLRAAAEKRTPHPH